MKKDSTLFELIIGVILVGIVAQIVCLFLLRNLLYHSVGLWVGIGLSVVFAIHMIRTIVEGLELAGEDGVKHMQKGTMLRIAIACVVIGAVLYFEWGNPLTLLVGVMALKVAAYLQPTVHRVLQKRNKGGRD